MVFSILEHTTEHGAIVGKTQTSKVKRYNLNAVISVGYRVNSAQATQLIKEYLIKCFAMDDERPEELERLILASRLAQGRGQRHAGIERYRSPSSSCHTRRMMMVLT